MGRACPLHGAPSDGSICAKLRIYAPLGGAGFQNVGNCSRHEPGSAAHWLDRKVRYERV